MTSFEHDLDGLNEQLAQLQHEQEQWDEPDPWFVGTAVEYAIMVEKGRGPIAAKDAEALRFKVDGEVIYRQSVGAADPQPFFQPAIHEAKTKGIPAFVAEHTQTTVAQIDSADELVETVAFALERRMKDIITKKGLIDTGTLRASVQAVPMTPDALPTAEEVEASAGMSL